MALTAYLLLLVLGVAHGQTAGECPTSEYMAKSVANSTAVVLGTVAAGFHLDCCAACGKWNEENAGVTAACYSFDFSYDTSECRFFDKGTQFVTTANGNQLSFESSVPLGDFTFGPTHKESPAPSTHGRTWPLTDAPTVPGTFSPSSSPTLVSTTAPTFAPTELQCVPETGRYLFSAVNETLATFSDVSMSDCCALCGDPSLSGTHQNAVKECTVWTFTEKTSTNPSQCLLWDIYTHSRSQPGTTSGFGVGLSWYPAVDVPGTLLPTSAATASRTAAPTTAVPTTAAPSLTPTNAPTAVETVASTSNTFLPTDNCDPGIHFYCRFGGCVRKPLTCDGYDDCTALTGEVPSQDEVGCTVAPSAIQTTTSTAKHTQEPTDIVYLAGYVIFSTDYFLVTRDAASHGEFTAAVSNDLKKAFNAADAVVGPAQLQNSTTNSTFTLFKIKFTSINQGQASLLLIEDTLTAFGEQTPASPFSNYVVGGPTSITFDEPVIVTVTAPPTTRPTSHVIVLTQPPPEVSNSDAGVVFAAIFGGLLFLAILFFVYRMHKQRAQLSQYKEELKKSLTVKRQRSRRMSQMSAGYRTVSRKVALQNDFVELTEHDSVGTTSHQPSRENSVSASSHSAAGGEVDNFPGMSEEELREMGIDPALKHHARDANSAMLSPTGAGSMRGAPKALR